MTAPLTLSAAEVADALGQSVSSIYDQVHRGMVPNVGCGRRVRIPRAWLDKRLRDAGVPLPARFEVVAEGTFV